jgi:hypothetical protein
MALWRYAHQKEYIHRDLKPEAAQNSNAENVLYLENVPDLAAIYAKDWT